MGGTIEAIKTIFAPAGFSLIVFLLFTHVFIPTWRYNRDNQNHYLMSETSMGAPSSSPSVVYRVVNATGRFFGAIGSLSSRIVAAQRQRLLDYRDRFDPTTGAGLARHPDDDGWLSDGEDAPEHQRGEELGPVRHDLARGGVVVYETRRLSRDLEQGFIDDSDDEDEDNHRRR